MIFKMLPLVQNQQQIYAQFDDDGKCRLTCTEDYQEFKDWLAEGNTPEKASTEVSVPAEENS